MIRDFKGFYWIFRYDFYVLFGVIKNSEGLFFLVAEYFGEGRLKAGGGTVYYLTDIILIY